MLSDNSVARLKGVLERGKFHKGLHNAAFGDIGGGDCVSPDVADDSVRAVRIWRLGEGPWLFAR